MVAQNGGGGKSTTAGVIYGAGAFIYSQLDISCLPPRVCSNCVPMATSFKLDPHEYLTLAPGSQRAENELFFEGFAMEARKPLAPVMNRRRVCVVLSGAKQTAINHLKLFTLASYVSAPPPHPTTVFFRGFSRVSEGSAASLQCGGEGPPRRLRSFAERRSRLGAAATCYRDISCPVVHQGVIAVL